MTVSARVGTSVKALFLGWLISGTIFTLYERDPRAFALWFWGMPWFIAGWVLVGLPLIALGDEVQRCPYLLLALAGGLGGLLAMAWPIIFIHTSPQWTGGWSGWYVIASSIGALTTILYRLLFERSRR
jgi:hypothetical protein